jgi:DNA uptake protein ComE-like DNA-binding protein
MTDQSKKYLLLITIIISIAATVTWHKTHSKPTPPNITNTAEKLPHLTPHPTRPNTPAIPSKKIIIYLSGEVPNPGIYQVTANQRVIEILNQTGGILDTADPEKIKLAAKVKDGQTLHIPPKKNLNKQKKHYQSHAKSSVTHTYKQKNDYTITANSQRTVFKIKTIKKM